MCRFFSSSAGSAFFARSTTPATSCCFTGVDLAIALPPSFNCFLDSVVTFLLFLLLILVTLPGAGRLSKPAGPGSLESGGGILPAGADAVLTSGCLNVWTVLL